MDDLLQYIDLDYYRSARLVIVRAEIAQLRKAAVSARVETPRPVDDSDQNSCDADAARLSQLG